MYDEDALLHLENGHSYHPHNSAFTDDRLSSSIHFSVKAEDLSETKERDISHSSFVIWEFPDMCQILLPKHIVLSIKSFMEIC
jgi:hypothetical protein